MIFRNWIASFGRASPYGRDVRSRSHRSHGRLNIYDLRCIKKIDIRRSRESLGTLGGGNHFIEVDSDGENLYLVIHTGSRNLGLRVADLLPEGGLSSLRRFAELNRTIIKEVILEGMGLTEIDSSHTIHNYINTEHGILRKGVVSAQKGERLLIPMNMRDGALLCTGLGKPEWNYSAPHGAGRLLSRKDAFSTYTLRAFQDSMNGIYTTFVAKDTIDECPMVYKPMEEIIRQILIPLSIDAHIRPIYNFKASERHSSHK